MAKSANKASNDKYRADVMEKVKAFFLAMGEDVQQTASNKICFPFTNELKSDEWMEITMSIPLGSRKDNTPFDGYEQAEDYERKKKDALIKAAEAEAAKQKKIAFDKKKREIAARKKAEEE